MKHIKHIKIKRTNNKVTNNNIKQLPNNKHKKKKLFNGKSDTPQGSADAQTIARTATQCKHAREQHYTIQTRTTPPSLHSQTPIK